MNEGILSAIGNTPLIRLSRAVQSVNINLYAKLEGHNPGGSMKDRPAINIIKSAIEAGDIHSGTTIIESSSGNMGIGLAQACRYYDLRFICVVDPKTTLQNIRLLQAYGAEVDLVRAPDPTTGEYLQARVNRVKELLDSVEDGFWPNQYSNVNNPIAHHRTMQEIMIALGGKVDYVFCAASTCGTLRGCVEYARASNLKTSIIAVDAVGSVIFGGERAKRLIPGHGAAVRPALYQDGLADRCIKVTDVDCIVGCRRLMKREAILAGGSSGAILMALETVKHDLPAGSSVVLILPDRGERYLDTIYSDEWVIEKFGDILPLWEEPEEIQALTPTF